MPGEMALVGEARGRGGLRQGDAFDDQRLCPHQALSDLEAMGRGAEDRPEMAGEGEAVEPAHPLQLVRAHDPPGFGHKEIARLPHRTQGQAAALAAGAAIAAPFQKDGDPADRGVDRQRLERIREIDEGLLDDPRRRRIVRHGVRDMGRVGTVERLGDRRRVEIEHAIGEGAALAGMAVMRLVRMQHQDLPRPARAQAAAIVELLDAIEGEADPVGLVPVQVVGMAAESPLEALQAGGRSVEADLVERAYESATDRLLRLGITDLARSWRR